MNPLSIKQFQEQLNSCSNIVLVPHKNPDGDAIGSSLGLYHYFLDKGKKVSVVVQDGFPYFLDFLPGSTDIVIYDKNNNVASEVIRKAELVIIMDHCHIHRSGDDLSVLIKTSEAKTAMIDHHPNPDTGLDFYWHETGSSSTCELVFSFIRAIDPDFRISTESATCLYAGLLTDTGCFKYNLRPQTFETGAELLRSGIHTELITTSIFDVNTPSRIQLLGYCLNEKLVILPELRTAYIALTAEELTRFNVRKGDTEGIVNYTLSIQNIVFGAFFHEREPQLTKISFRSKGSFAVNEIAEKYFSGGGHQNAAGGQFEGKSNEAVNHFREILQQYQSDLQSLHIGR